MKARIPGKIIVNMPIPQRQVVTSSTALVRFPPIQVLIFTVSQIKPVRWSKGNLQ